MKRFFVLCILLAAGSSAMGGGFPSLKLGADARSGGLGLAGTALTGGSTAAYWNPAGLSQMTQKDILLSIHRWVEGVHSEFLSFGWGNGDWGFGLHAMYTEVGDIEYRDVPSPQPLTTFSASELALGLSLAKAIHERISVGLTVKMLYEKIFIDEAFGIAADFGIQWEIWEEGLRAGGVIQNVGSTGKLDEESIDLPVTARVGLAYPTAIGEGRFTGVVDLVKEKDFPVHLHGGIEAGYRGILFVRAGYQTGYETRGVTGGIGFAWKGYRLDYAYMPVGGGFGDSHRLSVGIGW